MTTDESFSKFLSDIEPSRSAVKEISLLHNTLRDYLKENEKYKDIYVESFLSGSYAKHTSIRPTSDNHERDVDIDIVTNHTESVTFTTLVDELKTVLANSGKYDNFKIQAHSVRVKMAEFDIDIVPLIKNPSDELFIGSTEESAWQRTNPIGHVKWCSAFNKEHDCKFVPLIKLFKWWRQENCPAQVRYPKGIALEKIIADNIGDTSLPYEKLLIQTFSNIVESYQSSVGSNELPIVLDPSVEDNNLLKGYKLSDFKDFLDHLNQHIQKLDTDGLTNQTWKAIMGDRFPNENVATAETTQTLKDRYKEYLSVPHRREPIWSLPKNPSITIIAEVTYTDGTTEPYQNDGKPLPKGTNIDYHAVHSPHTNQTIKWQVVNTGEEAKKHNCLRGGFEESGNCGRDNSTRHETTGYTGKHYVQCFMIKKGQCIGLSEPFFINVE